MELREYRPEDCEAITRLFYDTVQTAGTAGTTPRLTYTSRSCTGRHQGSCRTHRIGCSPGSRRFPGTL